MSIADKFEVIADAVYEAGKDSIWSAAIPPGRTYFRYGFSRWGDADFSRLEGVKITDAFWMFSYCKAKELDFDLDLSKCTAVSNMFTSSSFRKIKKIILNNKGDLAFTETFKGANQLEEISFEGVIGKAISFEDCKLLNRVSIISIVRALSDDVGAILTLSQNAVVNAFGSIESTEWRELIDSKKNWEIALG